MDLLETWRLASEARRADDVRGTNEHHERGKAYARRALDRRLQLMADDTATYLRSITEWAESNGIELGVSDLEPTSDGGRLDRRALDLATVDMYPRPTYAPRPFDALTYLRMHLDRGRRIADDWAQFIPPVAPLTRSEWDAITEAGLSGAFLSYDARARRTAALAAPFKGKRGTVAASARRAAVLAERSAIRASRQTLIPRAPIERVEWARVPSLMRSWSTHVATLTRPDSDVQLATTLDPMGIHPWSLAIQGAATALLSGLGEPTLLPDVYSRRHGRFVTRPDHVAFKGVARWTPSQPCTYGRVGSFPSVEVTDGVSEYLTVPKVRGNGEPNSGTVRMAWRGHRSIIITLATRSGPVPMERQAVSAARKARGAAVKGPNVNAWDRSPEKLARTIAARGLIDDVARLEAVVRTTTDGHSLTLTDGTSITLRDSLTSVTHDATGRTYGIREWSRRAVLAGLQLAD